MNSVLSSTHLTLPDDRDPLIGAQHSGDRAGKYLMPNTARNKAPLIAWDLPRFVTTRGGEYFLLPSLDTLYDLAHDVPPPPEQEDCPPLDSPDARPDARPDTIQGPPRRTSPTPKPECPPADTSNEPTLGEMLRGALKDALEVKS